MFETLKNLCEIHAVSGCENSVRDYIIEQIKDCCEYKIDNLGNLLFEKKGKNEPRKRVMIDAHMDEVGIIITSIDNNGFLRFETVGGIEKECLRFHRVMINLTTPGVIGGRPVHLCRGEAAKKLPEVKDMYIDIGETCYENAAKKVRPGDTGVLCGEFVKSGDKILSKALDDRVGCAVLIELIKNFDEYGFCGSFSVCEEVGCIGARTAAFSLAPDIALILEGTTAADVAGVEKEKQICALGEGVAVSFMDKGTVYDRELYDTALSAKGINKQIKRGTSGGNNASAVHLSREGVKTLALSVPCRYIHSSSSVCDARDIKSMYEMAAYMLCAACE